MPSFSAAEAEWKSYWWILLTQLRGHGGGDESVGPVDESPGEEREEDVGGVAGVVLRGPVHRRDRTPVVHQPGHGDIVDMLENKSTKFRGTQFLEKASTPSWGYHHSHLKNLRRI